MRFPGRLTGRAGAAVYLARFPYRLPQMIQRLFLLVLATGALSLAGCKGAGGGTSDTASLDSLATGPDEDLLAYNAGFETGGQLIGQDSSFSYARFKDGFEAGLRGDSVEIAYALGLRAGLGLRDQQQKDSTTSISPSLFLTGLRSGVARDSSGVRITPEQVQRATARYNDSLIVRQLRAQAATDPQAQVQLGAIRANAAAGTRYLAEVARRPGVQRTSSGILYKVSTPGAGASPTDADQVEIRYVGTLPDGTEFDRSQGTAPTTLPVAAVVPGFAEALKMMKPGETATFWIPASLAYGLQGAPGPNGQGGVPPNSALQFELTLVRVMQAAAGPQGGMFVPPGAGGPPQGMQGPPPGR